MWNPKYGSFTYFGLDHAATCWLGKANDGAPHNAETDAIKSMQIFNLYCRAQVVKRVCVFESFFTFVCLTCVPWYRSDHSHTCILWQKDASEVGRLQALLMSTPVAPSFAKLNPEYEGCCMGNKKTCTCGAPFFC